MEIKPEYRILFYLSMALWWLAMLVVYLIPKILDQDYDSYTGILFACSIFFLILDSTMAYRKYRKWIILKQEGFKGLWKKDDGRS